MPAFSEWLIAYKYFVIFPLAIFEGPIVMVLSGFFLKLGYLTFLPAYLTLMAGDLTADILWYGVGYRFASVFVRRYGKYFSVSEEILNKTVQAFHRHQKKILFISKITMGLGFALVILIAAGMSRVPFKKYLALNALGQIVWTGFLMGLGYSFGQFYLAIDQAFRRMTLIAFVLLLVAAVYGLGKYLRKRDLQNRL